MPDLFLKDLFHRINDLSNDLHISIRGSDVFFLISMVILGCKRTDQIVTGVINQIVSVAQIVFKVPHSCRPLNQTDPGCGS